MEREIVVKRRDLNAKSDYELRLLEIEQPLFVPVHIIEDEEIKFVYHTDQLVDFNVKLETYEDLRVRRLINISLLKPLFDHYDFTLNPDNLMMDVNGLPKVLFRDVKVASDLLDTDQFLNMYKSLIGTIYNSKYSYEDYYQGGSDLLLKSTKTKKVANFVSVTEVAEFLTNELQNQNKEFKEKQKIISKKSNITKTVMIVFLTIGLIGSGLYGANVGLLKLPKVQTYYNASSAYSSGGYDQVISSVRKLSTKEMDEQTLYVSALSYLKMENLSADQKTNISLNLSKQSDRRILSYWVELGRDRFEVAIDLAKQLGNTEYILYAYIKQKAYVEQDMNLSGVQREAKLEEINKEITKYSEAKGS